MALIAVASFAFAQSMPPVVVFTSAVFALISIANVVFLVMAIIHIFKAENDSNWKVKWILICLFLGIIGVALYYFIGKKKRKGDEEQPEVEVHEERDYSKLANYIAKQLKNGYSETQINKVLRETGYSEDAIEKGFMLALEK